MFKKKPQPEAADQKWEEQLAKGGLRGLLGLPQACNIVTSLSANDVRVLVAPNTHSVAEEQVKAVAKSEGKRLKSHIQGFEPGTGSAGKPHLDVHQLAQERRDRRKSREDLLAEKERRAKEEREKELRERRERREQSLRREAELMAQIRREKAEAERQKQRELIAAQVAAEREREKREKAERKKAAEKAIASSSDDEDCLEPELELELEEETARHDESIIRIPPTISLPAAQQPPLKSTSAREQPPTTTSNVQTKQPSKLLSHDKPPVRRDTPIPVRAADNQRKDAIRAKLQKASLRRATNRTNGVQFAKGYRENVAYDGKSKLMTSVVMASFAKTPLGGQELSGLPDAHKKILETCALVKQKWTDPEFPPDDTSLWKQPEKHKGEKIIWKRIDDICPQPSLFVDGVEPDDILQGTLGDCWFLGPLSVVALHPNLLMNLFNNSEYSRWGVYSVQFWMGSQWLPIVVDDWIPCSPSGKPLYAHSRDRNEFWVMILEKAYAKVHGSYEALESGSEGDAFYDLTGCPPHELSLTSEEVKRDIQNARLWERLVGYFRSRYLIGCSRADKKNQEVKGILCNHAYGVIDIKEVNGIKLIKIRNPWGEKEWEGDWSDRSPLWTPEIRKQLDIVEADDGVFWMCYEDFVKYFTNIYLCSQIPGHWCHKTFTGEWKGITAGGSADTPSWRGNPQYYIRVPPGGSEVAILVSQPSIRSKASQSRIGAYPPIGFYLHKTQGSGRLMLMKNEDMLSGTVFRKGREASEEFSLAEGEYVLIPCTHHRGVESKYHIAVYSEKEIIFEPITEEVNTLEVRGEWTAQSGGGCANNSTWKDNPQFYLTVTETTKITIIQTLPGCKQVPHHGFYLLSSINGVSRNLLLNSKQIITKSEFINSQDVAVSVTVEPGNYIVVPCTFQPGVRERFALYVSTTNNNVKFGSVVNIVTKKHMVEGEWKGKTAGGSGATWINNPQYSLSFADLATSGKASISLSTPKHTQYVMLSVMALDKSSVGSGPIRRVKGFLPKAFVARSEACRGVASVSFDIDKEKIYYIVPSTPNAGEEARFTLEVQSEPQPTLQLCDVSASAAPPSPSITVRGEHSVVEEVHAIEVYGRWKGESCGGCVNYPTWRNNPQYMLRVSHTRNVTITLKQNAVPVLPAIGFYLVQGSEDEFMMCHIDQGNLIQSTPFAQQASVSMTVELKASHIPYIIIPATFDPELPNEFMLSVKGDGASGLALSPLENHQLSIAGEWRQGSAGGCKNHPSWRSNPQYHIKVSQAPVKLYTLLSQADDSVDLAFIGFYIVKNEGGGQVMIITPQNLLKKSDITDDVEVGEMLTLLEAGIYTIIPCTFEPGIETQFKLNVYANEHIETISAPFSYTRLSAQGEWTSKTAGGSSGHPTFSSNPSFVLSSPIPGTSIGGWNMASGGKRHVVDVIVVLSQPAPTNTIGLYVATKRDKRFISKEVTFIKGTEVSVQLMLHRGMEYSIIACTHDPGALGRFTLDVYTSVPNFSLVPTQS